MNFFLFFFQILCGEPVRRPSNHNPHTASSSSLSPQSRLTPSSQPSVVHGRSSSTSQLTVLPVASGGPQTPTRSAFSPTSSSSRLVSPPHRPPPPYQNPPPPPPGASGSVAKLAHAVIYNNGPKQVNINFCLSSVCLMSMNLLF